MALRARSNGVGFVDRLKTGWTLTKDSVGVIREYPKLLVFPLLAAVASVFFLVLLFLPLVLADVIGNGLEYVVLFVLYFLTTFVSTYFAAALVYAANETFHGREPEIRSSMRAISGRLGPIAVWAVISATVSVLLRTLEDADNPVASILRSLFALGWSIMTFFVVPVLVFEDVSATEMFERSGETFRDTWGETLGAGFGITAIVAVLGVVLVLAALVVSAPLVAAFQGAGVALAIVLVALALVFTYLTSQTVWGIAKTALYVYAAEGTTPSQFENFDFQTLGGRTERRATPGSRSDRRPGESFVE
ncbi:MAG: DUF6159 family protein [Natronomonas sp.]|uniref:DUF6159 family protein n=1 Tax=Natronomonas sp. TaxID=2184060 RepID=UPI00286FF9CF|nr:DUF6159 family protein [Natronomonas sp.]MDR9380452.1 DUF6159 family protein [Natronomonas sp.]MDR9429463.1 DUF6159 family protein [Natronomonas sp.]